MKLSSVPGLEDTVLTTRKHDEQIEEMENVPEEPKINVEIGEYISTTTDEDNVPETVEKELSQNIGVRVADDDRYRKYFKMLQFGVPPAAVKLKMSSEGIDPMMLE